MNGRQLRTGAILLIVLAVLVGSGCWGRKFFRMPEETRRTSSKIDSLLEENSLLKERIARVEEALRAEQDLARGRNAQLKLDLEELKDQLSTLQEMLRAAEQSAPARSERRRTAQPDTSGARLARAVEPTSPERSTAPGAPDQERERALGPPSQATPSDTMASAGQGGGPADSTAGLAAQVPPAPEEVYRQMYLDYSRKEYQLALEESESFLTEYPDDPLGEEVLFIRGGCLMELQNYFDALKEFSNLMQAYPQGKRVPGALLRMAISYDMLGEREVAAGVVRRLLKEYPRSEEASAAKERFGALLKN